MIKLNRKIIVLVAILPVASLSFLLFGFATQENSTLDPDKFLNSNYCGECHSQIFQEWNASMHHFSSLNNPVYRKVVLNAKEQKLADEETLKSCQSCHDPLLSVIGDAPVDEEGLVANAGITCLVCHRMVHTEGANGKYTLEEPILHPFFLAESEFQKSIHQKLVKITPSLHRLVMTQDLVKTPEFCATCHTLSRHDKAKETNLFVFNEYNSWRNHYLNDPKDPAGRIICSDCHMPLVTANDPAANDDGKVRSHRFAGSNTIIPALNRDYEQVQAVKSFLSDKLTVNILSAKHESQDRFQLITRSLEVKPGETVRLAVEVMNKGVGHDFPTGFNGFNEASLNAVLTNASGNTLTAGKWDAPNDRGNTQSLALGPHYVDEHGNSLPGATASLKMKALASREVISPRSRRIFYFDLTIPKTATRSLELTVDLNWRKYSKEFAQWALPKASISQLDDFILAKSKLKIHVKS